MQKTTTDGGISAGAVGPTPNTGEPQAAFMERCTLDSMMMDNYPTVADREAACRIQWGKGVTPETKAEKAMEDKVPLAEATDALKAVTGYLTMDSKKKTLPPDETGDEPSFETFREGLQAAEEPAHGGITPLRGHRRTRSGA